jgi:hypothetical protein
MVVWATILDSSTGRDHTTPVTPTRPVLNVGWPSGVGGTHAAVEHGGGGATMSPGGGGGDVKLGVGGWQRWRPSLEVDRGDPRWVAVRHGR